MSLGDRSVCRAHYLASCYKRLEQISQSVSVKHYNMTQEEAEAANRFLQDCMRTAADFASAQQMPSNLESAQVYDVLLWASELHGRLRRSPRKAVQVSRLAAIGHARPRLGSQDGDAGGQPPRHAGDL